MVTIVYIFLLGHTSFTYSEQRCITPNGELATCKSLLSCSILYKGILYLNDTVIEYARNSQCQNQSLVCCGSYDSPMIKNPETVLLPNRSTCGYEKEANRVLGGEVTDLEDFPWMALLGYVRNSTGVVEFKCGGTLINNRYVLTAAHCIRLKPGNQLTLEVIRLGEWRLSTTEDCEEDILLKECADPVIDLRIEKQIAHPKHSLRSGLHDIGLLRLERNIDFSDYVKPICLPSFNSLEPEPNTKLSICGWGATENGPSSDYKLKLQVPIVSNNECQKIFMKKINITDQQMCAGGEIGKDSCQGDSGGPLMSSIFMPALFENQWFQEGIISSGIGCGSDGLPGIYTRISSYMRWILENLEEF